MHVNNFVSLILAAAIVVLCFLSISYAATITVNSTADFDGAGAQGNNLEKSNIHQNNLMENSK